MTGSILRGIGSFYTVLADEDAQEYTLRAQKKLRHQKLTPMVGDRVRFTPGEGDDDGWIEEILPRKSELIRPSVANADMLMLVVASVPQPDMLLVDKLILRAERGGMTPAICVNKVDLGEELAQRIAAEYAGTELRVFSVSARTGEGIDALREAMRGKVTCLAGQSAVGKSSLLNAHFWPESGDGRPQPQDRARAAHHAPRGDDGAGRIVCAGYAGLQPAGTGDGHGAAGVCRPLSRVQCARGGLPLSAVFARPGARLCGACGCGIGRAGGGALGAVPPAAWRSA